MASIINATTSSGIAVSGDNSGALQLQTNNGNTAVTITTGQLVGVGTTSPTNTLQVAGGISSTSNSPAFQANAAIVDFSAGNARFNATGADNSTYGIMTFNTASANASLFSERMRINVDGNVLIGTTSYSGQTSRLTVKKSGNIGSIYAEQLDSGGYNYNSRGFANSGSYYHFNFEAGTSQVGSIVSNGSNTTYNTGSDYRLKKDISPMTGGLDKVKLLKPVTWKWKSTGEDGQGFIAHELAEICPDSVTGQKDAVDEDGNPIYQMVDVSYLVATLTAAIQELKALVDTQAQEIAALQAKVGA
jgi:Chaperone of endosialidase